jgi:inner membrane protein
MELFAHTGITLGAATVVADIASRKPSLFDALTKYLDIRWLLIGSLLPDIIDKPVGMYFFRDFFSNGRIFSHSLLFLVVLIAIGFYLERMHRQTWMLTIAAGVFMHLILDSMWLAPSTLFWPFMGASFPREEIDNALIYWWNGLITEPGTYIPEIIGFVIIVALLWLLIKRKKVLAFILHGKVN